MATLTETAHLLRRGLVFGGLLLIGYFVLNFGLGLLSNLFVPNRQRPAVVAEVRFGKLPLLNLPPANRLPDPARVSYTLETISGGFPAFPETLPVFTLQPTPVSLLISEKAAALAAQLGFSQEPQIISPIDYQWLKPETQQTLKMNILTSNFLMGPAQNPVPDFPAGKLPAAANLTIGSRNWLSSSRPLDKSFPDSAAAVTLEKAADGGLAPAASYSEAQIARVDFFRTLTYKNTEYRLLTIRPGAALVFFLYGGGRGDPYLIQDIIWNYDLAHGSTYPLKTPSGAWTDLQNGGGVVVGLAKDDTSYPLATNLAQITAITVRDVSLAYFDEAAGQSYLQPIYVFTGQTTLKSGLQPDITLYVPAVAPAWVVK